MVDAMPFRGIRYNRQVVGDLAKVLCPPYDVISPQQQDGLYQRSPHNIIRVEMGRELAGDNEEENRYSRAASELTGWRREGVLQQEPEPSFYVLRTVRREGVRERSLRGVFAGVRLEEFSRGVVLPHEETRKGPKEDRLRLFQATRASVSPVLGLYRDGAGEVDRVLERVQTREPVVSIEEEGGTRHQLWAVSDQVVVQAMRSALSPKRVYIADGHHRYETALYLRGLEKARATRWTGREAVNYCFMCLIEVSRGGLQLGGYHRGLGGLAEGELQAVRIRLESLFDWSLEDREAGSTGLQGFLAGRDWSSRPRPAIGLADGEGRLWALALKDPLPEGALPKPGVPALGLCESWVLNEGVIRPVFGEASPPELVYLHDVVEMAALLRKGAISLAFLLPPLKIEPFEAVVLSGERLPPKSTYFYPKLPTGLVIFPLEGEV